VDPYSPINGISLEQYADLGAELDGITDPGEQQRKVATLGVAAADWEAAKAGWTQRMQDMSLMGQVATRYMQLYNAALAAKKGTASLSFEDWVEVTAAIQVYGYEGAMAHFKLSMGDWTTISAHWNNELTRDMNVAMRRNQLQDAEANRMRAGGAPKPIQVTRQAAGAPVAGGAAAFDANAGMQQAMAAAQPNMQAWQAYSAGVMNQAGVQQAVGMAAAMAQASGGTGLIVGRKVLVAWSDGNKYPGNITQLNGNTHCEIVFPDGRKMWVENQYLTPA
jgi:hypothetical protein